MNIKQTQFEEQLFGLICYMVVSARNLMQEPKLYGPLRMVDATGRLLSILARYDVHFLEMELIRDDTEAAKASIGEGEQPFTNALEKLVSDLLPIIMHNEKTEDKQ